MIKKQIDRVRKKIQIQVHAVFGVERRKNGTKRRLLEDIFREQTITKDREIAMTITTLVIAKLRELRRSCGDDALWDILRDD